MYVPLETRGYFPLLGSRPKITLSWSPWQAGSNYSSWAVWILQVPHHLTTLNFGNTGWS